MGNSKIILKGLVKKFDKTTALDRLSLTISRGEIYGLIGRNGAGKTTAFNILSGLTKPNSGSGTIFGLNYDDHALEIKRDLGVMKDASYLYDQLTGAEYLSFVGSVFSLTKKQILDRSEELFDFMELNAARNRLIHEYSRGMKKKLTLASIFLHRPKLMVLDEPFEGIDPVSMPPIRNALLATRNYGATVVFSTHILEHVERLCTTIGIIDNGRLEFEWRGDSMDKIDDLVDLRQMEGRESRLEQVLMKLKGDKMEDRRLSWISESN